jgi:hypothetical protein
MYSNILLPDFQFCLRSIIGERIEKSAKVKSTQSIVLRGAGSIKNLQRCDEESLQPLLVGNEYFEPSNFYFSNLTQMATKTYPCTP